MKILKSAVVAFCLALSLGSFSTTALACEDGRTCIGNEDAVNMIVGHIGEALKEIDEERDSASILSHIRKAKNMSKEINVNDVVDRNRMKANGFLKKAKFAVRRGEMTTGTELLTEARKRFAALPSMF